MREGAAKAPLSQSNGFQMVVEIHKKDMRCRGIDMDKGIPRIPWIQHHVRRKSQARQALLAPEGRLPCQRSFAKALAIFSRHIPMFVCGQYHRAFGIRES